MSRSCWSQYQIALFRKLRFQTYVFHGCIVINLVLQILEYARLNICEAIAGHIVLFGRFKRGESRKVKVK